jgi:hypothetical protein
MKNIIFVTIASSKEWDKYNAELCTFFADLDVEKKFFTYLNMEYVKKSDFMIAAFDGDKIVGVAGVETTHLIAHKGYVGAKKEYQKIGLGAFLSMQRNNEAKKRYDLIILKIDKNNIVTQKMSRARGYKVLGRRFSDDYLALPFNSRGVFLFNLLRLLLPIVNALDPLFMTLRKKPKK